MALTGNTVVLKADFIVRNEDTGAETYVDPTGITLKIFDESKKQIGDTIEVGAECKKTVGVYRYRYIVPEGIKAIVYEFSGTYDGYPLLGRGIFTREWVRK